MESTLLETIDETLETIIKQLNDKYDRLYDALLSCGENFNAQLIAKYNDSQGIKTTYLSPKDAGILVTDLPQQAQILEDAYDKIYKLREIEGKLLSQVSLVFLNITMLLHFREAVRYHRCNHSAWY